MKSNNKLVLITDVDGVLSTPYFFYSKDGKVGKSFSANDSLSIKLLKTHELTKNIFVEVIALTGETTGEGNAVTAKRMKDIGLPVFGAPNSNKFEWIKERYDFKNVVYFGDDIHDFRIFKEVGFSACPSNAPEFLKREATFVSKIEGGKSAFTDMVFSYLRMRHNILPDQIL